MEITNETKWTPVDLGPRQAKAFNEAIQKFGWEAKTKTEITDYGEHSYAEMFGGSWQPAAAPALLAIKQKYNATVTGSNYKAIIAEVEAATLKLRETRPVIDKRTTPEQRAERERILAEAEAKRKAEADHLATLQRHEYGLAETSKAIKRVLGVIYPQTVFSVRSESYSGGNSIDASWTDGPTSKQVQPILDVFKRAWFDGMEDLEHHVKAAEWNGHLFDFTGKYISANRGTSAALLQQAANRFADETGQPVLEVKQDGKYAFVERQNQPCGFNLFTAQPEEYPEGCICKDDTNRWDAADIVNQIAHVTPTEYPAIDLQPDIQTVVFRILLGEIGKPETEPAEETQQPAVSRSGVTLTENHAKDGYELRFPSKPAAAILDRLKANNWHWSRFSSCWYHKRTPQAKQLAESISGATIISQPQNEDYPCSDAGYEDACKERCGL